MTAHAADEERERVSEHLIHDAQLDATVEQPDGVHEGQGQQRDEKRPDVPTLVVEGQDERHQVDAEREKPKERHHRNVHRHLVGGRQEQTRPARGEQQPQEGGTPARTVVRLGLSTYGWRDSSTSVIYPELLHRAV